MEVTSTDVLKLSCFVFLNAGYELPPEGDYCISVTWQAKI